MWMNKNTDEVFTLFPVNADGVNANEIEEGEYFLLLMYLGRSVNRTRPGLRLET
jgi:hypothetical protein